MATNKVYMIATPIGNLEDITQRGLRTLREVNFFFAEDTRELAKLLDLLGIGAAGKKIFSFSSHNMKEAEGKALRFLQEGNDIGFVCDRGTPCISDPGYRLVELARREGYEVLPVPGPSSITALVSVAGVDTDQFVFIGFPPLQDKARNELWDKVTPLGMPVLFLESPKRFHATAQELAKRYPKGKIVVGREMTKQFETYSEHSLAELNLADIPEKGEFAVLLVPGEVEAGATDLEEAISLRLSSDRDWAKAVAKRCGVSAHDAYNALQKVKR